MLGHSGCVSSWACGVVVFHTQVLIPATQWKAANPQFEVKLTKGWSPEALCEPRLPSNLPEVPLLLLSRNHTLVLYSCFLQRGAERNGPSLASALICLQRRDCTRQLHGEWPWHDLFSTECKLQSGIVASLQTKRFLFKDKFLKRQLWGL